MRKTKYRPPEPQDFIAKREWQDRVVDLHSNKGTGGTIAARALQAEKAWRAQLNLDINLRRRTPRRAGK